MKRKIPTDEASYRKIVNQVSLRMQASADWHNGRRDRMRRAYERWHRYPARPEGLDESADYEVRLGYAFGLIEQIDSKITEPLLNMGLPYGVFPSEFGDQAKADNFADVARDFYGKPNVQMGKRKSKKERTITGTRWEIDEWLHVVEPGKRWGKIPAIVEQEITGPDGKPMMGEDGKPKTAKLQVLVDAEVPEQITTYYGYNTRYPSVFDVYPEPNRTTIDTGQKTDISWLVEDLGELALEDMAREVIYDPETKQTKPRYDFTKLIEDAGAQAKARYANILAGRSPELVADGLGPVIQPIHDWTDNNDKKDNTSRHRPNDAVSLQSFEDRDKIWVAQMRCKNEIVTIAQGKFIIERILDPWHRPRIGARVEVYTLDPRSLYGIGALDPVLDELDELDITHSLGMQNLFRLVNKMIAVKEKALISMDDLDPRGGGIVRINDEVDNVGAAVQAIVTPSAVNEMLAGESDTRGMIEFVTALMDGAPGVAGTKQQHKTKGGMQEIRANLETRFATMQALSLINESLSGQSMEYFFAQFAWEPVSYRRLTQDGSTVYAKFTKDDIDTQGRGFQYLITVDPIWGNTQQQRQDAQEVFNLGIEYEKLRTEAKDPAMKKVNLSILFEDLLKKHGRRDLSRIFTLPDGEISPEQELQILIQGGVVNGCKGDKEHHVVTHLLQAQSPQLKSAMEAGKAAPDTATNLMRLIAQAQAEMITFLKNPQMAASDKLKSAGMRHPGADLP